MKQLAQEQDQEKKKISPAKKLLMAFMVICLGVLIYDLSQSELFGSITGEAPVVNNGVASVMANGNNASTDDGNSNTNESESADSFYSTYRMQREQTRASEMEILDDIITNNNSSSEAKSTAEEKKITLQKAIDNEMQVESLLLAKSFGESVVMIADEQVTVVLSVEMDNEKAGQIAEIVDGVTGIGYENVIIVPR